MSLINIAYGSLASSETMNKNFLYLEDKIDESSDSLTTSISSVLSNIATINGRLNDFSEDIVEFNTKFEKFMEKTKSILSKYSMVPNWGTYYSVSFPYTTLSNGYLLILTKPDSSGNIQINSKTVQIKNRGSAYDNAAELITIPVKEGDVVASNIQIEVMYFIPALTIEFEDNSEESN